jgi:hypothetical protein
MSWSRKLPVVVDVPKPCDVDWEDMVGDERGRFCGRCGKTVTNLSVLDGDQIAGVLARGDCVSFLYREDASIMTAERRAPGGTAGAKAAAVVLAATMALTLGCDARRTSGAPLPLTPAASGAADGDLRRTSGEPLPPTPAASSAAAAGSAGTQGGATVSSAQPASSGVAASASAEPAASCTPGSKAAKDGKQPQVAPSERLHRTAGVPRRPTE